MEFVTRFVDNILVVRLLGSIPPHEDERLSELNLFCQSLSKAPSHLIVNLQGIDFLTSADLRFIVALIRGTGVRIGGLGAGPYVRIVTESNRVRSTFLTVDAPFWTFETEDEALWDCGQRR